MGNYPRKDSKSKYSVDEVLKQLWRKGIKSFESNSQGGTTRLLVGGHAVHYKIGKNEIVLDDQCSQVGNKTWGKLDFLQNYNGYYITDLRTIHQ